MILSVVIEFISVLAVLMKDYTNLCHCLPQNYMKTIDKLKLLGFPDEEVNYFTNLTTADLINDGIVAYLMIVTIKSDAQALQFCDVMDKLVDRKSSQIHIKILRNGK